MVAGSHAFLRWLYASGRGGKDSHWPDEWRWRWTVCGFAMLTCTLLAIGSAILTTHQIYWLSKSSDPLVSDPFRERYGALMVIGSLRKEADELQWDSVKTRESFDNVMISGQPAIETLQPVWVERDDHSLRAIILIPRRPLQRAKARLAILQPGKYFTTNLDELPRVLASFGIGNASHISTQAIP